jgi:uridine phosphorylase
VEKIFHAVTEGIKQMALNFITVDEKLFYIFLRAKANQIRPIVINTITPQITEEFVKRLKMGKGYNKSGKVHNGRLNGVDISVIRTEMGAPNEAIFMELMHRAGVKSVLRCDVCGSLSESVPIGSVFTALKALIGEGTSPYYLRKYENDPAIQSIKSTNSIEVSLKIKEICLSLALSPQGVIWTTDALFCEDHREVSLWQAQGAMAVDMETSVLYLLGQVFKIHTLALMGVIDKPGSLKYDFLQSNTLHPDASLAIKRAVDNALMVLPHLQGFLRNNN